MGHPHSRVLELAALTDGIPVICPWSFVAMPQVGFEPTQHGFSVRGLCRDWATAANGRLAAVHCRKQELNLQHSGFESDASASWATAAVSAFFTFQPAGDLTGNAANGLQERRKPMERRDKRRSPTDGWGFSTSKRIRRDIHAQASSASTFDSSATSRSFR
jgi:hypothetical protein